MHEYDRCSYRPARNMAIDARDIIDDMIPRNSSAYPESSAFGLERKCASNRWIHRSRRYEVIETKTILAVEEEPLRF